MAIEPDHEMARVLMKENRKNFERTCDPLTEDGHGRFVHHVLGQRRHFAIIKGVITLIKWRPLDVSEPDKGSHQILILQGRVKASVVPRPDAAWPVAMGTVG